MAETLDPFKIFVNTELPKRLSTEVDATKTRPGFIPVSTGIGLGFDLVDPSNVFKVGLVTDHQLPIDSDGTVALSRTPMGGVVLDMALVLLKDGSYLEVIGVKVVGDALVFLPDDYRVIRDIAESVSVTYLANLAV